ncbi:molybdenum cofactor guanylyltransferase [Micromonospora sp. NPDC003197]
MAPSSTVRRRGGWTARERSTGAGYGGGMTGFAAVVLTGGAARRMGGADKPAVPVGGRPMRDRVLAAVAGCVPRIVVGPVRTSGVGPDLPADVQVTREDPPGGGPVAATAAGLALIDPTVTTTALLAGDLPMLTAEAIRHLAERLAASDADGVVYLDDTGRRQLLCGVWRTEALRVAIDRLHAERAAEGHSLAGASMRALMSGLRVAEVSWADPGPPPWFDCDTDDDVRRAEEWTR